MISDSLGARSLAALFAQVELGSDWYADLRRRSFSRFRELGLPQRSLELWKYTALSTVKQTEFVLGSDVRESRFAVEAPSSVQILGLSQAGVKLSAGEMQTIEELLEESTASCNSLAALNGALSEAPSVIVVPKGVEVEGPIRMRFGKVSVGALPVAVPPAATGSATATPTVITSQTVIVLLGAGAKATLIEESTGESEGFAGSAVKINLAKGANLQHVRLQDADLTSTHFAHLRVRVAADARFEYASIAIGALRAREDVHVSLQEPRAEVAINGLSLADGVQHIDTSTLIEHLAPNTVSHQRQKNLLSGKSQVVFHGRVHMVRAAKQSSAAQQNNNLLLSRGAEVDTKPELEIDVDDVKATHGATISRLDDDQIFYLQARGIESEKARMMLSRGFAEDVVLPMQNHEVRNWLAEKIHNKTANLARDMT